MDHAELRHVSRSLGAIGRHHYVTTGSPQPDQGTKRARASACARPTNGLMPEPCNDSRDDLAVPMSADQHMGAGPSVPEGDHELLGMPERKDDMTPLAIQRIDRFMATSRAPHRACDPANGCGSYRREERIFYPTFTGLNEIRHWSRPEIAWRAVCDRYRLAEADPHAFPFRQWLLDPKQ